MARRTDEAHERHPSPSTLGRAHLDCGGDAKAARSPPLLGLGVYRWVVEARSLGRDGTREENHSVGIGD